MHEESDENETQQCEMLSAFARIACAATDCLNTSKEHPHNWKLMVCTSCDEAAAPGKGLKNAWDEITDVVDNEDWIDCMAAMLAITREPKFQASPKARVLMAVAIGRVFNHISDNDYLKLETCELGQWLLGSMSRSLRELKLAATWVSSGHWRTRTNSLTDAP